MTPPNARPGSQGTFWDAWLPRIGWGLVGIMLALLVAVLVWHPDLALVPGAGSAAAQSSLAGSPAMKIELAALSPDDGPQALVRLANDHT